MELIDIEPIPEHIDLLYQLLLERPESANISHSEMPSYDEHVMFVMTEPYYKWLAVKVDDMLVGAVYITHRNEIGIGILKDYNGMGYGSGALEKLVASYQPLPKITSERHGQFVANINPDNSRSIELFERLGFRHMCIVLGLEP